MMESQGLVLIRWVDSASSVGVWNFPETLDHEILHCESIGWVVCEDDEKITIAAHWTENQVSGDMIIPKCAIKEIWEITL